MLRFRCKTLSSGLKLWSPAIILLWEVVATLGDGTKLGEAGYWRGWVLWLIAGHLAFCCDIKELKRLKRSSKRLFVTMCLSHHDGLCPLRL